MHTLGWIVLGGLLMSALAMVGSVTLLVEPDRLERVVLPLVSLAASTLLGGALFHMIPEGTAAVRPLTGALWVAGGFSTFLGLEQFLRWHHSHTPTADDRQPMTYLVLIGDAVHNFLGGLGIASTFLLDARAGLTAWVAVAARVLPLPAPRGRWTRALRSRQLHLYRGLGPDSRDQSAYEPRAFGVALRDISSRLGRDVSPGLPVRPMNDQSRQLPYNPERTASSESL